MDHINIALDLAGNLQASGLEDVQLIHQSIPGLDLEKIDLRCSFLGKHLAMPVLINAITGGVDQALEINRDLALVAGRMGIAMAVGSQTIGLEDASVKSSFKVVRDVNPEGLILANVSANTPPDQAFKAVEMIDADGLQLHLNVPQELAMPEGDRNFRGVIDNIAQIVLHSPVPVIAKEVGFGLSRESAAKLYDAGVRFLDVGGRGGTGFIAIEQARGGLLSNDFLDWGIPTAASIAEVRSTGLPVTLVASGGIRSGLSGAKAMALGADLLGMAGHLLKAWATGGTSALEAQLTSFAYELKCSLLMTGISSLNDLKQVPVVIGGNTARWLECRDIDLDYRV
ncbi:MAG: type 2 isopentenyl-diphosphate Delta-isomerase [Acidobacteriota bacterium]